MRAAALIAGDDSLDRIEARERVEETLELERALMNGRFVAGADRARRLGRGEAFAASCAPAALGELGADLSATADETLIATGLAEGRRRDHRLRRRAPIAA